MNTIDRCRWLLLATLACAGCSSNPPASPSPSMAVPVPADYAALATEAGAKVFTIDPAASHLLIFAFRGGRAAFAGHDHVLTSHDFIGHVYLPGKVSDARFDLEFPLAQLTVDDPTLRAQTGGVFAEKLDADAIAGTRSHMLGPDNLDAAHFPALQVHSERIVGDLPRLVATVLVTLHGQTRPMLVPIEATVVGDQLHARGSLAIRQTDFGVHPYSILGGLLAVQDEISIEFDLTGRATGG